MNIKLLILVTMYILVSYVIFQGGIGLNVAQMIVELIRDKRKIVDRMTREQIDEFVGLLQKSQVCTILKF
jgi:inositol 1,4,5-triphosphate receptor type 1